jgi:carboxypeptidase D
MPEHGRRFRLHGGCAAVLIALLAFGVAVAGGPREVPARDPKLRGPGFPARVELGDETQDLQRLHALRVDVDGVFDGWARIYVDAEEGDKLRRLGFTVTALPDEGKIGLARLAEEGVAEGIRGVASQYHTYDTLSDDLQAIAAAHTDIVRLTSIGRSVEGRELWMVKITDQPDVEEFEPGILYIAAMHGDEVVGKELCFNLIQYLTDNYPSDPRVTQLVDETEIWILPSMNPDGTQSGQRWNANGVDLNRDFPDQFVDPVNSPVGREPETGAVMSWGQAHNTVLSSNFHGGALVANYPYDSNPAGSDTYSPSADDAVFISLARTYADNNPALASSNGHPAWDNGITNGADWYAIDGGMQDWHYLWRGNLEVLVEVSGPKWPSAASLPGYWSENLESMLSYFERTYEGIRGLVTDAVTGLPVAAEVRLDENPVASFTDPEVGDYHRVVLPGRYRLEFSATGYSTRMVDVVVSPGPALRRDVMLEPLDVDLQHEDDRVVDGGDATLAAGEAADLAVTLRNLGLTASGIEARLAAIDPFVEVTRESASYPDLAPGATGESAPPHHGVSVSPSTPPGHKLGFVLEWTSEQGAAVSQPFFVPVGLPQCESVVAGDAPHAIADHQATNSSLVFGSALEVESITVDVDISHTYRGDLRVELVSPSGSPVLLHNRTGGSANDIVGTYGGGLAAWEPLERLAGEPAQGSWSLVVRDAASGDVGNLNGWAVEICGRPLEATPPEMGLREVSAGPAGVTLEWWPYPGLESYRVYRSVDPTQSAAFTDITAADGNPTDTRFEDGAAPDVAYYLVTGVGAQGEGPKGHFGE